jgi:L-seryl-tRNA(Ser) seleniumtransferase
MSNTRRDVFRAGAALGLAGLPAAAAPMAPEVYTRIGAEPFINLTATYTINGGALTLPEVKRAMEEASHYPVNLDELMEKVGARLAHLLGAPAAMVSSGCAAAMAHATAACITGGDPEKMQQLPRLDGLKDEVIMPKQSRNVYDHAFRMSGARIVEIDTREDFERALGARTAAIAVLGTGEAKGKVRLEELVAAGHKAGVPVLVDAAAELPVVPNPYLSRGADLVGYSGGKFLRGPQCAGLLIGRKDLIAAAWINSAPHHAFGRAMKVGKEEIMGMLAAVEVWRGGFDLEAEYRKWQGWFSEIAAAVEKVPGITTRIVPPAGASPFPVMDIAWDPDKIGITAGELGRKLLYGTPRIMSHAEGEGFSFIVRPVAMKPGEARLVGARLAELFAAAPKGRPKTETRPPAADISGRWQVDLIFAAGAARHEFQLTAGEHGVTGEHTGRIAKGKISGAVDGDAVKLASALPYEGTRLPYRFRGKLEGGAMSGEVDLGEYGRAKWSAKKLA